MSESNRSARCQSADASRTKHVEQSTSYTACKGEADVSAVVSAVAEKQETQIDWVAQERKARRLVAFVEAREGIGSGEAVYGEDPEEAQEVRREHVDWCPLCGEGYGYDPDTAEILSAGCEHMLS